MSKKAARSPERLSRGGGKEFGKAVFEEGEWHGWNEHGKTVSMVQSWHCDTAMAVALV